MYISIYVKGKG